MISQLLKRALAFTLSLSLVLFSSASLSASALAVDAQSLETITQEWEGSLHAMNDINCSSCHEDQDTKEFVAKPTGASCKTCHEDAVDTFLLGKHGIRLLEGQTPFAAFHGTHSHESRSS